MVNMLFWFIVTPTGPEDTIRTIVTSMAAVLSITMTMRIILSVRGSLVSGGSFAGSSSGAPSTHSHSRTGPGAQRSAAGTGPVFSINPPSQGGRQTYNLQELDATKPEQDWDGKNSLNGGLVEGKPELAREQEAGIGVKVTVERQFQG